MRRIALAFVYALVVSVLATSANATTWYVDSGAGNDTNNGKSLGTSFLTLQHAAGVTVAGDTVCIEKGKGYGGGTGGTAPLVISTSGTAGNPITYTGCNGSTPITAPIPGELPVLSGTQAQGAIQGSYPLNYVTINGLEVAGWNGTLTWAGASANAGAAGTSWESTVYIGYGLFFGGGTSAQTLTHITFSNNIVHDFPGGGIACNYCDYVTVSGNVVHDNALYNPAASSGISLYELHNVDAGTGTKDFVTGNAVYNNQNLVINHFSIQATTTTTGGAQGSGTTNLVVTSSAGGQFSMGVIDVSTGCIPPGTIINSVSSGHIQLSQPTTCSIASGATIQYGYLTDGEGIIIDDNTNAQSDSIPYVGRILVSNNLVVGNGSGGIQVSPTTNNVDVTFNTLYLNQISPFLSSIGGVGEIDNKGTNGSNFYNNISVASGSVPSGWDQATGTTTWSNNGFFGGSGSHTLPGTNNVTTSPLFVNATTNPATWNFKLQAGSPEIDAGSATFTRTTDFFGAPGLTGPSYDIGANESYCSPFGTSTVRTPTYLVTSEFQDGQPAKSITPGRMRDLISTLYCGRAP